MKKFFFFFIIMIILMLASCKEHHNYSELPVNYIVDCPVGLYDSPYQNFKAVRIKEKLGACFVYKYYDGAILKEENKDMKAYNSQKEPFGEVCVYPLDERNFIKNKIKNQEEIIKEVGCQPILNRKIDN